MRNTSLKILLLSTSLAPFAFAQNTDPGKDNGVKTDPGLKTDQGVTTTEKKDEKSNIPVDSTSGSAGARAVGLAPAGVNHSNFMDTRLTWTFGDDDFLNKTGVLVPLSPTFSLGDRQQYRLFFDNLNSRFAGRENITHLVLYKKMPGFIDKLTTEAALVLRLDLNQLAGNSNNVNSAFYDSGSYLRIFYQTGAKEREGISAVFFPLDTDRFRLGYLYDISWGGTAGFINESIFPRIQGSSPGMKVQFETEKFYAFAGFKTATIIQPEQVLTGGGENDVEVVRVGETNFGFLAGAGADPTDFLHLDVGAGHFNQGKFDLEDVRGERVSTTGASARLVLHKDMPVPQSVDFRLYRNDPMSPQVLFAPQKYKSGEFAWSISAEGSYLSQRLKDFDNAGQIKSQGAIAAALQAVVKAGYARFSLTGIYRDLNYVVRNVPGFIPFETLPSAAKTDPELFGALAADYYIESARLTPSASFGLQMPATFRSEFTEGGIPAVRSIIVRRQGDESILPYNKGRTPIMQARAGVTWGLSDMLSMTAWVQYVHDGNG
ncbi:MAG: hypothetical protein KBF88_11635, partial [Polyangiaceae bacterium]|nr:hypothetical protein [Polyangiaceae bacterium]